MAFNRKDTRLLSEFRDLPPDLEALEEARSRLLVIVERWIAWSRELRVGYKIKAGLESYLRGVSEEETLDGLLNLERGFRPFTTKVHQDPRAR